jgi:hypothetical protein
VVPFVYLTKENLIPFSTTVQRSVDGKIEFVKVVQKTLNDENSFQIFELGDAKDLSLFAINTGDRFEPWQISEILNAGTK